MSINYSQGRYVVVDASGKVIGRIDCDEFVRSGSHPLYRVDGEAVYDMAGSLLGFIENGVVSTPDGSKLLSIKDE